MKNHVDEMENMKNFQEKFMFFRDPIFSFRARLNLWSKNFLVQETQNCSKANFEVFFVLADCLQIDYSKSVGKARVLNFKLDFDKSIS